MQRIGPASPNDASFIALSKYWRRDQSGRSGFSDSIGFQVILAFWTCCLLSKKSPIYLAGLSENGKMYFERKLQVQKKKERRSPRFETNT